MASKVNLSALTLNNEEARSAAEVIFEGAFARPEISDAHYIMTGVEMDKYIPIMGQFGLAGKINPGSCGVNTNTGAAVASQKTWTPKLISDRLIHCIDDVPDKVKFWKKNRIALQTWEGIDNECKAFIEDTVIEAMAQAILRISSFGDTSEDVIANGGHLTAGTDKTYFNMLNGMWQQIFTDQAGSALSHRYTISENSGATYTAQLALAADAALLAFRAMYEGIDARAFNGNLVFQVTRSLFNNWQSFMEDKSLVFQLDRTEAGSTKFSYRGIPIIVRYDWDRIIRTYFDNATTYYLPHRAILTDITNIPIGTSDTESLTSLDAFYDKTLKSHYIDFAFKLDQKNILEYNLACAY
jgi:hypothetical protein